MLEENVAADHTLKEEKADVLCGRTAAKILARNNADAALRESYKETCRQKMAETIIIVDPYDGHVEPLVLWRSSSS